MFPVSLVFVCVGVFTVPGRCCHVKEYVTQDGQCCPMCHKGTVVSRDCTVQTGTQCVPCKTGTFMNQPSGLKKCLSCTSCDTGHGLFTQQICTPTSDAICDVSSRYYCKSLTDTGCSLAEKHTQCAPGQRVKEPGTSRTDTVCDDCQPGFFSQDGVNCTAWTICSETQVKVKEGSQRDDVVCGNGSRNHYCFLAVLFYFSLTLVLLGCRD
ncbi:hypothetical protein PAMA_021211 [Pampus argenteus]